MNSEKEVNLERVKHNHHLINTLRSENNSLHRRVTQEFTLLQHQSAETIKHLQSELEQAQELRTTYERDVSALRQKAEIFEQTLDKEKKAHNQNMMSNHNIINKLGAELENMKTELQDREAASEEKSSVWKMMQHTLKLKKQQKGKRSKNTSKTCN